MSAPGTSWKLSNWFTKKQPAEAPAATQTPAPAAENGHAEKATKHRKTNSMPVEMELGTIVRPREAVRADEDAARDQ
ncbi:hypothetical protein CHLRE_03g157850v5 [Chlamydomonas reinhardtii]|uniref:Uncharacterized protein n=1 Tax=Chlamydomonas reinhardtii TaxID=3055 RepID=A0A2K3DW55_CHLRE|nr:uncharacterized protein CHLRE_03g157850v5 [Chlamydomonas reinhardtii]PNW84768.1 hypothetical protein CHLRE_03g157850v5 [Chlamydomonas reinhardtii]